MFERYGSRTIKSKESIKYRLNIIITILLSEQNNFCFITLGVIVSEYCYFPQTLTNAKICVRPKTKMAVIGGRNTK